MSDHALTLALSWIAGQAGHYAGDYLDQPDHCAQNKQKPGRTGWAALARHVAGYTACQTLTRALAYRAAGLRVPVAAQAAGGLAEGLAHGLIDDGRLLQRYAEATGKRQFHALAAQGMNGRALLDQAAHLGLQIPLGALVTTAVAGRSRTPLSGWQSKIYVLAA